MDKDFQRYLCTKCEHSQIVSAGNFAFLGCYHTPYKGKWVAEIDECPMGKNLHLCDVCVYKYPECNCEMLEFGNGVGHDNITNCDKFTPKE